MKRVSLIVLMVAAMLALMGLTAAPAFAAGSSPPAVGGQNGDVCGGQGNSVGSIAPASSSGSTPGSVGAPVGAGCSSGCSSTKGQH